MEEHIKIFTSSLIIVERLKSLLEKENIRTVVKNHNVSSAMAGFGTPQNSVELFILNSDLEKAKPIIEQYKKEIN